MGAHAGEFGAYLRRTRSGIGGGARDLAAGSDRPKRHHDG